jgi:ribosome-associated protein
MNRRAAPHRGLDVHYGEAAAADEPADSTPARPSKSQLKRESLSLQALGEELVLLSEERLAALDMPQPLREALAEYRRTRSHEGRRRQMQYIGKLMRSADEEPLREAVAAGKLGTAREALALHEAERWRAELIDDDAALTRWIEACPGSDVQQLRSLVRAARRDAAGQPPEARQPKSFRELFQFLKPHLERAVKPEA